MFVLQKNFRLKFRIGNDSNIENFLSEKNLYLEVIALNSDNPAKTKLQL